MARRIHTVTLPDGTTAKRTSKTRTYTHAVAIGPRQPGWYADHLRSRARGLRARADLIDAAVKAESVRLIDRRLGYGTTIPATLQYHSHELFLIAQVPETRAHAPEVPEIYLYERCNADGQTEDRSAGRQSSVGGRLEYPIVDAREVLLRRSKEYAERDREQADLLDAQAADALGGKGLGDWGVVRWTSRADLARQYVSGHEYDWARREGCEIRVLEVESN